MRMLGFGKLRAHKGKKVCDWALHILSPWRLLGPHGIITGHQDLWEPINEDDWSLDWDYESGNLQDKKLLELFGDLPQPQLELFVEDVQIKKWGDLEIFLSRGYKIETFLNHSKGDSWLIFQPGDLDSFFTMSPEVP